MTDARPAIPHATEALTRRTSFRKAAIGPWDPRVQQIWLYNLADAATKYDVEVHHTTLVLNHHHTSVTPRLSNISPFLERLHQPVSCAINTLLQRRGFDAMDNLWDGKQPHRMRLVDAAAMMSQLLYERLQPVAAGLVDRPEQMPGFVFDWSMWRPGAVVRVDAPDVYFDMRFRPKTRDLRFDAPALLLALFNWNVEKLIYVMRKLERFCIRKVLAARTRPSRGAAAVLKIHPFDEPRTRRETRGRTIPTFRIGARGMVGREIRIRSSVETTRFREDHRECSRMFRNDAHESVFPYGTDKMVRVYGARVEAAPADDAMLIAPPFSREEYEAECPGRRGAGLSDEARTVIDEVKCAFDIEASLFEGESEAVFLPQRDSGRGSKSTANNVGAEIVRVTNNDGEGLPKAADEVVVQTLRGPRQTSFDNPPRRIVVRRTRHAVPSRSGRRASDEPDE